MFLPESQSAARSCLAELGAASVRSLARHRPSGSRLLPVVLALSGCPVFAESAGDEALRFNRDIRPILSDHCFACHGPDAAQRKGDLRLDQPDGEEGAYRELGGSAAIRPGDRMASEVYRRIIVDDPDDRMPPPDHHRQLSPEQIEQLGRWIDEGATWGDHWAFAPLERPAVPAPSFAPDQATLRNPIDAFVHARLARESLVPSPEADRITLIRRITLDLTGLAPTPDEVDAFVADASPDAVERVVDRLLDRPSYGERMAWEWLEAARYADSNGYQGDAERTMWPWRDWVVSAFNTNMPYDRFTVLQLAGDLLPDADQSEVLPTAFNRNHMINGEGGRIPEENRVDYVMDMAETAGTVWLGLTMNCCRCHDHKFDPLTQADYYRLFAFFDQTPVDGSGGDPRTRPVLEVPSAEQSVRREVIARGLDEVRSLVRKQESDLRIPLSSSADSPDAALPEEIAAILRSPVGDRTADQWDRLAGHWTDGDPWPESSPGLAEGAATMRDLLRERDVLEGGIPRVMVMADQEERRQSFILERGLYTEPGAPVLPDVPGILPPLPPPASGSAGASDSSTESVRTRLDLARWLVAPKNPLTARVTVNRFWQQFFGVGLVKTPEDFGVQAEFPSHPEVLDWLACEFRDSGWNVKRLVRLIVTSATYRQQSKVSPELHERDPDNRLLARGSRFRLPSWMIRDQALSASGLLVDRIGGAPVHPYQPEGVWQEATFGAKTYPQDSGEGLHRRSIYTFWRRIVGPTMFFDVSSRQTCSVGSVRTNTPLHALVTLNDVTYVEAARALAQRCLTGLPSDASAAERIDFVFRQVLGRPPSPSESVRLEEAMLRNAEEFAQSPEQASAFLGVGATPRDESLSPVDHASLAAVCLAILNLDEALSRE